MKNIFALLAALIKAILQSMIPRKREKESEY